MRRRLVNGGRDGSVGDLGFAGVPYVPQCVLRNRHGAERVAARRRQDLPDAIGAYLVPGPLEAAAISRCQSTSSIGSSVKKSMS